jgi:hypothetical protein
VHLAKHLSQMFCGESKYIFFNPPPLPSQISKASRTSRIQTTPSVEPRIIDLKQVFSSDAFATQIKAIFSYKHKIHRKKQLRHGAPLLRSGRKRSRFLGFGAGSCSDDNNSTSQTSNVASLSEMTNSTSNSSSSYDTDS